MYYTDEVIGTLGHHCLLYTVLDDIVQYPQRTFMLQHQHILYCFRSTQENTTNAEDKTRPNSSELHNNFTIATFEQLKIQNVTGIQLFVWSAPIDLIERYAAYLMNDDYTNTEPKQLFYNCTLPWFGPTCEYTFESNNSFSTIVKSVFEQRHHNKQEEQNQSTTCYIYLTCKYGGLACMCLDWREICDGKVDCVDEAEDEQHCFALEINECEESEYRCQNGLCVSQEFLRDGSFNPECLDRTDETIVPQYPENCVSDPSFRCEEHACKISGRHKTGFSCGDGTCNKFPTYCYNGRGSFLHTVATHFDNHDLCWMAMFCLTDLWTSATNENYVKWCHNVSSMYTLRLFEEHCPALFHFPTDFVLFGHVRLVYSSNITILSSLSYLCPAYVCYEEELCKFLPATIFLTLSDNQSMSCRHFRDLNLSILSYNWVTIVSAIQKLFHACSSMDNSTHCQKESTSLFHCPNSVKCISKHRLVDGIRDCGDGEDESYENSCDLTDKYRFKCPTDGRCLAPALVSDGSYDCRDYSDEQTIDNWEERNNIFFQTLCDGFVELVPISINGREETDETDCEHWQCNNSYTRCDGIWNCYNGADEVNCPLLSICPLLEHNCVSPITYNAICLPIHRTNDGQVDCVGGTDERQYCRRVRPKLLSTRFLCGNNLSVCLTLDQLCNNYTNCPLGDDERFCQHTKINLCGPNWNNKRSISEEILCQLDESSKPTIVYFALHNFSNYPQFISATEELPSQRLENGSSAVSYVISQSSPVTWPSQWHCNRGLIIRVLQEYKCLCPPSYYGDLCEYQNQRVSLTIRLHTVAEIRTVFVLLITLIDDDEHIINFYDQFSYIAIRDCNSKFDIYLMYATRPKDQNKNYSVRIDVFEKHLLTHRATWLSPVRFPFLPVYRMSVHMIIPLAASTDKCTLKCNHGHCLQTMNSLNNTVCQCDRGWGGKRCEITLKCNCSPTSVCMGLINNRSICLCSVDTFGPRCYLTHTVCQSQPCNNGGQCIPNDSERQAKFEYSCLCKEGYSGNRCEYIDTRIDILFQSNVKIPSTILVHFITIYTSAHPLRTTLFKKIAFDQDSVTLYTSIQFRLIFTQFDSNYYMTFHRSIQSRLSIISTMIQRSHRCLSVSELFNSTILDFHTLRRIKYYHLPCQKHDDLTCFYDPLYICLCTTDRRADCFEFDHNITYNCQEQNFCENGAQCFQDDPKCPKKTMCMCKQCFYGTRCQFSTKGFDLSLDTILGYHIRSDISFAKQSIIVQISIALTLVMFVVGFVSGILSVLTFQENNAQKVGCGTYLLSTSITSLFTITLFSIKVCLLIVFQMRAITQSSFLLSSCVTVDFLLRNSLNVSNWLNACVTVERAVTIYKGLDFNAIKSKSISKCVVIFVILFNIITTLHDPIHRQVVHDYEEHRTWCIVNYSVRLDSVNSAVVIFHFCIPFIINIIFALVIIIMIARQRLIAQQQLRKKHQPRHPFRKYKHLLISPCILVILAVPRLVMTFFSGCMNSVRDTWFFLLGYFVSLIPPILTFVIFVLPSEIYKKDLLDLLKKRYTLFRLYFDRQ